MGMIKKICDSLEDNPKYIPRGKEKGKHFKSIIEEETIWTINGMPTKSCESDAIPTGLLKTILPSISKTLTLIVNVLLKRNLCNKMENHDYTAFARKRLGSNF